LHTTSEDDSSNKLIYDEEEKRPSRKTEALKSKSLGSSTSKSSDMKSEQLRRIQEICKQDKLRIFGTSSLEKRKQEFDDRDPMFLNGIFAI